MESSELSKLEMGKYQTLLDGLPNVLLSFGWTTANTYYFNLLAAVELLRFSTSPSPPLLFLIGYQKYPGWTVVWRVDESYLRRYSRAIASFSRKACTSFCPISVSVERRMT